MSCYVAWEILNPLSLARWSLCHHTQTLSRNIAKLKGNDVNIKSRALPGFLQSLLAERTQCLNSTISIIFQLSDLHVTQISLSARHFAVVIKQIPLAIKFYD